jgi:two-component system chemotaxis sensor kinase CheA
MPETNSFDNRMAELRRDVESLALELILAPEESASAPVDGPAAALRRIGEAAAAAGCEEVAGLAAELLASLGAGPDAPAALSEGIQRLQEALDAAADRPARGAPAAGPSLGQDPELLADFIVESREHLSNVENQLIELERNPGNLDNIHSAFRGFHTIKGLAGFLELDHIREVAHEIETVLDLARNQQLAIRPDVIDVVLGGADYLKAAIAGVEAALAGHAPPPPADPRPLIGRVRALAERGAEPEAADTRVAGGGEPAATGVENEPEAPAPPGGEGVPKEALKEAHTVKVNTLKLDHLVDMVGELVVAQSLLRHDPDLAGRQSPRLQRNLSQLARITTDVQRTAMSMRMVPVGALFRRMQRLVRDLARKEGKQVELVTSGDDVELDRNIVEELADPLLHMLRNAVGHALETPQERRAAGKPPAGRISLAAWHQSGFIVIELADDGRGIQRERVRRKAVERGLIAESAELTDAEVVNLIFEPGFSTAAEVNDVSGRGVGMDVVKRNITRLRGRVEVRTVEGRGTTISLKVPLTLAIIEGLVVGVGGERYIVPIYAVREMLRPAAGAVSTLHGRDEMVTVRGRLLPVVRLHRRFKLQPRSEDPTECLLLVAETVGKQFCLMVDDLIGKQEVVIKSLGEALKNVPGVAGGAILGDGHVGLILDVDAIFGAAARG